MLAHRDAATGEARGVSVDLARELAARLDVPLELVIYTAAGTVVEGIRSGAWDIAYLAIDPARAADIDFTSPYVEIEGAYLVPQQSSIRQNSDVDREGVRVVAARGSAYDLYLGRELRNATLVYAPNSQAVTEVMLGGKLDVAAGVKQQLQADARRIPGLRVLDGRFMVIRQAMALPKARLAGARYLAEFVEEMKATGVVAASLKRHGIEGAMVAPAGRSEAEAPAYTLRHGSRSLRKGRGLETGHLLDGFGVPGPVNLDGRRRVFELAQIVGRQLQRGRTEVLFEPVELGRAGDRHEPRLSGEDPGQGNLRRSRLLSLPDGGQEINQGLIGLSCLRREARERAPEVRAVELRVLVDRAGEEALAQRAEGHEADAQLLERRQDVALVLSRPQ